MNKGAITVVGSLNYDFVTYTNQIPGPGETARANAFETHTGGKGLNQAYALGRLKDPSCDYAVRMVGNVGDDVFGSELIQLLKKGNIDTTHIGVLNGVKTGTATIIVEDTNGGQNRILINKGANGETVFESSQLEEIFKQSNSNGSSEEAKQYVVFQQEIPDSSEIIKWIKSYNSAYQVVYNPSPFKSIKKEYWKLIDLLIVNEIEALQIAESLYEVSEVAEFKNVIKTDFVEGYKLLCSKFQKELVNKTDSISTVIITLGSKGVLFNSKTFPNVDYLPAKSGIKVVDSTGAGDTFLGSLVTQLYQGKPLKQAIQFSTTASSITIQRNGAAESMPNYHEVMSNL